MATRTRIVLVITALVTVSLGVLPAQPDPHQAVTAFVGVSVIPMDKEAVVPNQTVIVREQKIAWVGPSDSAKIPEGATRVEGKNKFLMPGLAEMHAHIPGGQAPDAACHSGSAWSRLDSSRVAGTSTGLSGHFAGW